MTENEDTDLVIFRGRHFEKHLDDFLFLMKRGPQLGKAFQKQYSQSALGMLEGKFAKYLASLNGMLREEPCILDGKLPKRRKSLFEKMESLDFIVGGRRHSVAATPDMERRKSNDDGLPLSAVITRIADYIQMTVKQEEAFMQMFRFDNPGRLLDVLSASLIRLAGTSLDLMAKRCFSLRELEKCLSMDMDASLTQYTETVHVVVKRQIGIVSEEMVKGVKRLFLKDSTAALSLSEYFTSKSQHTEKLSIAYNECLEQLLLDDHLQDDILVQIITALYTLDHQHPRLDDVSRRLILKLTMPPPEQDSTPEELNVSINRFNEQHQSWLTSFKSMIDPLDQNLRACFLDTFYQVLQEHHENLSSASRLLDEEQVDTLIPFDKLR